MFRSSPRRSQRSKGLKVKHALQICLLIGVCIWLLYQVRHSQSKKAAFDERAKAGNDVVKLGRKDLQPVKEIPIKDMRHKEDEEEEENKNEEEEEEKKSEGSVETQEQDQGKSDEDSENQDGRTESEKVSEERMEDMNGETKEVERENSEAEEKVNREGEGNEGKDEGEGSGQHERTESERAREENMEETDGETKEVEHENHENEEKVNVEGEGNERKDEGEGSNEKQEEDGKIQEVGSSESQLDDGNDRSSDSAREENYKGDDASSAVEHESSSENVQAGDDQQGGAENSSFEEQSEQKEEDKVEQENKPNSSESVDGAQDKPDSNNEGTEKNQENLSTDSVPETNQPASGGSPDSNSDEGKKSSEEQQERTTSVEVNTENLGTAPQNGTDLSVAALMQNGDEHSSDTKGGESTKENIAEDQSEKTDSGSSDGQSNSGDTPSTTADDVSNGGEFKDSSGISESVKLETQTPENTNASTEEMQKDSNQENNIQSEVANENAEDGKKEGIDPSGSSHQENNEQSSETGDNSEAGQNKSNTSVQNNDNDDTAGRTTEQVDSSGSSNEQKSDQNSSTGQDNSDRENVDQNPSNSQEDSSNTDNKGSNEGEQQVVSQDDRSIPQEVKDVKTDLETLPDSGTEGTNSKTSGCGWGLMRFFDLFNGHSSRKLISNAGRFNRQKKENDSIGDRPKPLPASDKKYRDEKKNPGADPRFTYVCNSRRGKHGQYFWNSLGYYSEKNGKMDQIHEYSTHHRKDAKGCWKFYRADSAGRVSNSTLTQVFCDYGCRNIGCVNNGAISSKVQSARVTGTSEAVVNRKHINRTGSRPKELLEALEIFYSNKDLFLRQLEDPNSALARHFKDLCGSHGKRPRTELFLRQHEGNGLCYGTRKENKHSLSLRRIKPRENSVPKRNGCTKQFNGIVILKPQSDFRVRNNIRTVQQSYFPSRRLRRKLTWIRQKKCMPLPSVAEGEAASARKLSYKCAVDLLLNKDCENQRDQPFEFSNWRDLIKKLSEEKFQRNSRSLSLPSYRVKDDWEPRPLRETKRSISSPPKLNVDSRSSECDKSDDQSNCLDTSSDIVLSTETQEPETTLVHMSSRGPVETENLQEEPSSDPGNIQEDKDPVICSPIEDHVGNLEYDQTNGMGCTFGSRMIVGESNDDLQSANDYVKALLVAADLDWDKLLVNSYLSDQILLPSLFDEVKIPCNGSDINQQLLFDYISEVLEEVHRCHQMKIRTFTVEKNMSRAVMKRVRRDRDLFLQKGLPTLEQLVCKDLAYFAEWIDISSNTEEIVTKLVEDILDDILDEV